jgi:uncharacterized protein DUF6152
MKRTVLTIFGAFVLFGPAVFAHHSHPDFLLDQDATVEGIIESIQFQGPHVLFTIRAADSTLYTAEWQAARYLKGHPELVTPPENGPVNSDTLKVGDPIIVVANSAIRAAAPDRLSCELLRRGHRPVRPRRLAVGAVLLTASIGGVFAQVVLAVMPRDLPVRQDFGESETADPGQL